MTRSILITGITGLIGGSVLQAILAQNLELEITALVRPGTSLQRYERFAQRVEIVELDLADLTGLKRFLESRAFDIVLHIGALRGGRAFSKKEFLAANLYSTQQICEYCLKEGTTLIFCSSVGVFGAIPKELPANNLSPRNPDNLYHLTKIESEKLIQHTILKGLKAAILRPSITYGPGDSGFPSMLIKLIDKRVFPLTAKRIWIHLCHIELITKAFVWLLNNDWESGLALNVADREPVQLQALTHFVSRQLRGKNYKPWIKLDDRFFSIGESLARKLKNELWISRFELISRSWFYEVNSTYELMDLPQIFTIPGFQSVIDDYKKA